MARTTVDTEDGNTLDGADVIDRAPEPDDEEQRTRDIPNPRTHRQRCAVSIVRGLQRR